MVKKSEHERTCIIIGASHAGVGFAFALRQKGWKGTICLYDSDPHLPYHRPPLSKTYLTGSSVTEIKTIPLKSLESYIRERIELKLGTTVTSIHPMQRTIKLADGSSKSYDTLVMATGARPVIPSIPGLSSSKNIFGLRTLSDIEGIRNLISDHLVKNIVVIGGGYIGLEMAASLRKLGLNVTILERETRVLSRVTAPEMSDFFKELHTGNGVHVFTSKNVSSVSTKNTNKRIYCDDGSEYSADIILVGVGIQVDVELAKNAGLTVENGITVDASTKTSDDHIYAIGDCTFHYNGIYDRYMRLESVQNAVGQAKVAAATISGTKTTYDEIPWFWSDQYNVKLQIVGLQEGYDSYILRKEDKDDFRFSIWYFKGSRLLAVDAVNNPKAYVYGTKFIKEGLIVDKIKLGNGTEGLTAENLILH